MDQGHADDLHTWHFSNGGPSASVLFREGIMLLQKEYQQCEGKVKASLQGTANLPCVYPAECKPQHVEVPGVRPSLRVLDVTLSVSPSGTRSASWMTRGSSYGPSRSATSTRTSGCRTTGWPHPSCTASRPRGSSSRCASRCATAPACGRRRPPAGRR